MEKQENTSGDPDKKLAAVCGLYCGACSFYIATTEYPERLKRLAAQFQASEEAVKCYGCRSVKRGIFCDKWKMSSCAAEREIDFCVECSDYPCPDLVRFQAEKPHRKELWHDLEQIKTMGYRHWLGSVREQYTCPRCRTINSAYDLKCRNCGREPSCAYVAKHRSALERYLQKRGSVMPSPIHDR